LAWQIRRCRRKPSLSALGKNLNRRITDADFVPLRGAVQEERRIHFGTRRSLNRRSNFELSVPLHAAFRQKRNEGQNEEHDEEHFCDRRGSAGNETESKDCGNQGNDEENNSVV
jgi:hypothetical protein